MKKIKTIHVAIGTQNPCKIQSVKSAFAKVFHSNLAQQKQQQQQDSHNTNVDVDVEYQLVYTSHNVSSNVNDQPIGDDETLLGAKNRAKSAFEKAMQLFGEEKEKAKAARNETIKNNNAAAADDDDDDDDDDDIVKYGPPDFGVGLEGGIEIKQGTGTCSRTSTDDNDNKDQELWCMAWMAIVGTNNFNCTICKHESSTFQTIPKNSNTNDENETKHYKWGISKTASFQLPKPMSNMILNQNMELGHADDYLFNRVNSKHGSGTVGVLTNHLITRSDYYDHALVLALISFVWPEHY